VRFATVRLVPEDGPGLHPIDRALATEPSVELTALHHFNLLADGTLVVLLEVDGDRDRVAAVVEDRPAVLSHDISRSDDGLYLYGRVRTNDTVAALFRIPQELELVVDPPLEYVEGGALRATVVGDIETIRKAIPQVPDGVGLDLERTGDYRPDESRLFSVLTERQRATLRAAVAMGYYEEPRAVTYADLAGELDIAPGTVGEHLRKAEAAIIRQVVPDAE